MKQHPIPHNILDIEFKLFGKLTLKQAGFVAVGVVTGGIFLLLRSNGAIPDILAWPAFLIFSGLGLFVGLIPINDQTADTIIANYFKAITHPTRRVWKNSQFKEKLDEIQESKELAATKGTMQRDLQRQKAPSGDYIIGSAMANNPMELTSNDSKILDQEEAEKLAHFQELSQQASTSQSKQNVQIRPNTTTQNTTQPQEMQADQMLQPQTIPQTQSTVPQRTKDLLLKNRQAIQQSVQTKPQPTMPTQKTQTSNIVVYSSININNLPKVKLNFQPQANIPYIKFLDPTNHPISDSIVLIKNETGATVQAHKTNPDGLIIPTRPLAKGNYIVEIQSNTYNFPVIQYVADGVALNAIQVNAR